MLILAAFCFISFHSGRPSGRAMPSTRWFHHSFQPSLTFCQPPAARAWSGAILSSMMLVTVLIAPVSHIRNTGKIFSS